MASRRIYLDSNALIRFIESAEDAIAFVFENAGAGLAEIFTSELSLAEVMVLPIRAGDRELVDVYQTFLRSDDTLTVVPINRKILLASAELRALSGSKTPESIHIATAVLMNSNLLISSDRRLRMPHGMVRIPIEDADNMDLWP